MVIIEASELKQDLTQHENMSEANLHPKLKEINRILEKFGSKRKA